MGTQEKGAGVGGACAYAAGVGIRTEERSCMSHVVVADLRSLGKETVIVIFYFHCRDLTHPSLVLDGCLSMPGFALAMASQLFAIVM